MKATLGGKNPEMALSTGVGFLASEPVGNQGPQKAKIDLAKLPDDLAYVRINEVTWKLTDGVASIQWGGNRSGGYKTARAVAWIFAVGNGRWIARHRDRFSPPLNLAAAKQYARAMLGGDRPGRVVADPIHELNRLQCIVADYSRRANAEI
jgi:hypothetical protein